MAERGAMWNGSVQTSGVFDHRKERGHIRKLQVKAALVDTSQFLRSQRIFMSNWQLTQRLSFTCSEVGPLYLQDY